MAMTAERFPRRAAPASASQRLRTSFAAARVSFTWFGVRKSLSSEQKAQAVESLGAEGQFISAAKKLLRASALIAAAIVIGWVGRGWRDRTG